MFRAMKGPVQPSACHVQQATCSPRALWHWPPRSCLSAAGARLSQRSSCQHLVHHSSLVLGVSKVLLQSAAANSAV